MTITTAYYTPIFRQSASPPPACRRHDARHGRLVYRASHLLAAQAITHGFITHAMRGLSASLVPGRALLDAHADDATIRVLTLALFLDGRCKCFISYHFREWPERA